MRIAVVDDERPARSELLYLLHQCLPDAEYDEANSSESLLELLEEKEFDVCFVDIDLGGANGTTLASMIKSRQEQVQIVFATAYKEYAVKAFELGAVDYILKPFDLERIKKTIQRIEDSNWGKTIYESDEDVEKPNFHKIMVNAGDSFKVVDAGEIIFIETEKRACKIHTKDGKFLQNESLNYYETLLGNSGFFRIHKSYLINLEYVTSMLPSYNNGYAVKMKFHEMEPLPIGRSQLKEFRQIFGR